MPPLFNKNQQLDESELVNSLAKKAPRSHKAMLMETFVEHYKWGETMKNIAMSKISASDEDSDTKRHKKRSNEFKEHEDNSKKRRNNFFTLFLSPW